MHSGKKKRKKKSSVGRMIEKLYLPPHRPATQLLDHRTFLLIPLFHILIMCSCPHNSTAATE